MADFLLAWWNAAECGGFDLTDLWSVDAAIRDDMLELFAFVAASHNYPDAFGYEGAFQKIIRLWRAKQAPEAQPHVQH